MKLRGDGLLAESPRVIKAVSWAVEVRRAVAEANEAEGKKSGHRI